MELISNSKIISPDKWMQHDASDEHKFDDHLLIH